MKVIIQVPCFNEAATLRTVLDALPRTLEGCDAVEWLVVNDGSTDGTEEVARACGVDHMVSFSRHQGLARAYMAGIESCLNLGADIIVSTDADNQYDAEDIPALIRPILDRKSEMVIGARPIAGATRYPFLKKRLQMLGSWVVRLVSKTDVPDAPCGFRAVSREAAMRFNVFNDYTYTLETIIQAGLRDMAISSVPIRVHDDVRPSRLVKSIPSYVKKSIATIVRIFVIYRPFLFFATIGLTSLTVGCVIGLRFLFFFFREGGDGHVQSLILASILLGVGFQTLLVAFLSDLLAVNRRLLEDVQYRLRSQEVRSRVTRDR